MARQARIVDLRDLRSPRAPLGDAHRVLVLTLHPDIDRLQPALQKPAGERIGCLAPNHHLLPNFLDERLVATYHAGENVVMSVQIFRGRMDDDVDTVFDGSEVDRTCKRGVDDERYTLGVGEALQRVELEYAAGWIYRGFEKNHSRGFPQRFAPRAWLERVYEGHFDPHSGNVFAE